MVKVKGRMMMMMMDDNFLGAVPLFIPQRSVYFRKKLFLLREILNS
jgi:hypothetical protein